LPVNKHRQLARQVGAFDDFTIESSTDLDINMSFWPGSEFIFGAWVCMADDEGKLKPIS